MNESEADFQKGVIEYAELMGWKVGHFHDSRRQVRPGVFVGDRHAAGIPDLIMVRERQVWAELKAKKGRLRREQGEWIAALRRAGQEVYLWTPSSWAEVILVLGR